MHINGLQPFRMQLFDSVINQLERELNAKIPNNPLMMTTSISVNSDNVETPYLDTLWDSVY